MTSPAQHPTAPFAHQDNVNPDEVEKFERLAHDWWDLTGPMKTLHHINPVRLAYVSNRVALHGRRVLDVGCGGGIFTEALARPGTAVSGLDAGSEVIRVAARHAQENGLEITYMAASLEEFAADNAGCYDVITCMELLEHVPDPDGLLRACARVLTPGGHLFLATINRTLRAWLGAVIGAERVLGLLPKGTHDYAGFIRPSELERWLRNTGFETLDLRGMLYIPILRYCALIDDPGVNYLLHARRAG